MRATIREVAKQAQVSRMTVSRVLQGRKNEVNEDTFNRVLAVMHDLNYVPVRPVTQNRQVVTNVIAVVPYYRKASRSKVDSRTYEGLCDNAAENGYDLFVMLRGEAEWMANREELRFLDRRSDGFIFISPGIGEWQTALQTLTEHKIPAVVCYRRDVPQGIAWVDVDNEGIIDVALSYLAEHGHTRVAYMSGPKSVATDPELLPNLSGDRANFDNVSRITHFQRRLAGQGEPNPEKYVYSVSRPDWKLSDEDVRAILDLGVTGLICGDDFALQIWERLEAMGLSVPNDFSIVGVDNDDKAALRGLTSIGFGFEAIGYAAVEAWLELNSGVDAAECCKVVSALLHERNSVAPPLPR